MNKHANGNVSAFAERVGIDPSMMSLLLHGHRTITEKTIVRICNKLQVEPQAEVLPYSVKPKAETPVAEAVVASIPTDLSVAIERLITQNDMQARVMTLLLDRVDAMAKELKELREHQGN